MKALKKAPEESAIKAYEKDPSKENEQALLTGLKPVYSHKGYRMDYTNKQNDWDTQNYSEVDLSAQEVFVYKKGKLVFSTTCITGKQHQIVSQEPVFMTSKRRNLQRH